FLVLFMVIIGGLGSILGSFLGAAFIVLVPIFLTNVPHLLHLPMPVALQKQIELMVFGGLIIFFLIVEPHGLARLWQITKEKLRLWPFPHLPGGQECLCPCVQSPGWPCSSPPVLRWRRRPWPPRGRRSSSRCSCIGRVRSRRAVFRSPMASSTTSCCSTSVTAASTA